MPRSILLILFGFLAAISRLNAAANASFDAWADQFSAEWARQSPQYTTSSQYFSGAEQDALDRQVTMIGQWGNPYGDTAIQRRAALARRGLTGLAGFPRETLSPTQRASAALMAWACEMAVGESAFGHHAWVFDQFNGLQLSATAASRLITLSSGTACNVAITSA